MNSQPNQICSVRKLVTRQAIFHVGMAGEMSSLISPRYSRRRGFMNGHLRLKLHLVEFWARYGPKRLHGAGFSKADKLTHLQQMASVVVAFHKQEPARKRRADFNVDKFTLHPWRRFGLCFGCGSPATARHHIIQLQNGGINSRKNIVSLCESCHAEIHPWL